MCDSKVEVAITKIINDIFRNGVFALVTIWAGGLSGINHPLKILTVL